jgi:anti-sigma-K factor RskA
MTDHQEEMLALHALRTLTPEEVRLLESESRYDPRMREALEEFEETAAEIAWLLPEEAPPAEMRAQLLTEVKARARANVVPLAITFRLLRSPIIAWAAAAAIAVAAVSLWTRNHSLAQRASALAQKDAETQGQIAMARDARQNLEKQLADANTRLSDVSAELKRVNEQFAVKKMELAMLRVSANANIRYAAGSAAVVWNQEKQEGILKLEDMPAVQPNKDYQLWVICKQCKHPVNAGVVKVSADGTTTVTFKPVKHIAEPLKFAISVEAQGGVPEKSSEGPIIFASR